MNRCCLLPKSGKIMAVLIGGVIDLYDPYLIRIPKQMLMVFSIDGDCFRGDLIDISAISVIMLSLLWVTENFPSLHDQLEFLFTGMTIRIFIGVVFED